MDKMCQVCLHMYNEKRLSEHEYAKSIVIVCSDQCKEKFKIMHDDLMRGVQGHQYAITNGKVPGKV